MSEVINKNDYFVINKKYLDVIMIFAFGVIKQPLIAYTAMKLIDDMWSTFWYTIIAINCFYFVMAIIDTVLKYILFKLYMFKRSVEAVSSQLEYDEFPTDDLAFYDSIEDVYFDIAYVDNYPCNIKIKAALYHQEYVTLTQRGEILTRSRWCKIHAAAYKQYIDRSPDISYKGFYDAI